MDTWENFLLQQPSWVRTLLGSVKLRVSLQELIDASTEHGKLILVSDGSGKQSKMSFGWVCAAPDGKRLADAAGPCFGRENSLRSEAAGMLSISLFLGLVFQYHHQASPKLCFHSDSSNQRFTISKGIKMTTHRMPSFLYLHRLMLTLTSLPAFIERISVSIYP